MVMAAREEPGTTIKIQMIPKIRQKKKKKRKRKKNKKKVKHSKYNLSKRRKTLKIKNVE